MSASARPFVLIVDDDVDLRELVAAFASLAGVDTETAAHGAAALEVCARRRPDLIILDMKMPVMDGPEFCRHLRMRPGPPPPVVIMTAAPNPAESAAGVAAEGWLSKPFEADDLLEHVRRFAAPRAAC
jgi:CheY-like chemotaxis protein